jgi:[ribosomal protein S18]-alanine N-acetyltransferase
MKTPGIHKIDVEKDIDVLFELDNKVARATPALLPLETPQELIDFLVNEHKTDNYLLNNDEGIPVGYLSVMDFDADSMEVLNLGTDPDFQGKGYGKEMMDYAEELAKEMGKKKIRLVTNVKNTQAIGFYKAIGYSIVKEVENYYGDGETRYIFEKMIQFIYE